MANPDHFPAAQKGVGRRNNLQGGWREIHYFSVCVARHASTVWLRESIASNICQSRWGIWRHEYREP